MWGTRTRSTGRAASVVTAMLTALLALIAFTHGAHAAVPRVAAGANHTLALTREGTVLSWGKNDAGQIGDGSTGDKLSPFQVPALDQVVSIAAGYNHSVALLLNGTVMAWGGNSYGQLGDGTTVGKTSPVQVPGLTNVVAIAAGDYHTLAVKSDGSVWAWGRNGYGQLGIGSSLDRNLPVQVSGLSGISMVAGGANHSLFLKSDGTVWASGANAFGQLGNATNMDSMVPVKTDRLTGITFIAAGSIHSMAVSGVGNTWVWGGNSQGQLGDGTTGDSNLPVQLLSLSGIVTMAGGAGHTAATKSDGTIWTWGGNGKGQVGDGTTASRPQPYQIQGVTGAAGVACGGSHTVALSGTGAVWTWGNNASGQLGDGTTTFKPFFARILTGAGFVALAGGLRHSVGLLSDGTVLSWGSNQYGQLGDGTLTSRSVPSVVAGLSSVIAVAAGDTHTAALRSDGSVWTWGNNAFGQLGDGTTDNRSVPTQVSDLTGVVAIASGGAFNLALKSNGTVWAWGGNSSGQLGDGTVTERHAPVLVGGLSDISAIAAGFMHSLALRNDGTVWAWGRNSNGQIGDGTSTFRYTAVQLDIRGGCAIAAGAKHSLLLKSDGTVWAWGNNALGQVGNGTVSTKQMVPVQAAGVYGVTAIAAGANHSLALRGDGTLWGWGGNYAGQLGDGTAASRLIPSQNQSINGLSDIWAGGDYSLVLKDSGTGWATGNNDVGELGDGTPFLPAILATINLVNDTTPPSTSVSPAGGTYFNGVSIALTASEPAVIRYTLDGSDPTTASTVYAGPISLTSSAVLKYYATDTHGNAEAVKAASYTIIPTYPLTLLMQGTGTGTVIKSTGGSCSGTCSESFISGTPVTLTQSAAADSVFVTWTGCDSLLDSDCRVTMTAAKTVTAAFNRVFPLNLFITGTGTGSVLLSNGESCTANCSRLFDSSALVTLTPFPGSYSAIFSWTGCDSINGNTCSVAMGSARNVTATFNATYPLALNITGSGGGTVQYSTGQSCTASCNNAFFGGTQIVMSAVADGNSVFGGWTGCDSVAGNACTVTVSGERQVGASFYPALPVSVSIGGSGSGAVAFPSGENCTSSCSRLVRSNSNLTLTAAPGSNSYLAGWSGCDMVNGLACTVDVAAAESVAAVFEPTYPLTVTRNGGGEGVFTFSTGGSCSDTCVQTTNSGTSVAITAVAGPAAYFVSWTGCDSATDNVCTVVANSAKAVSATFGRTYRMNLSFGGYGEGRVDFSDGQTCNGDCSVTLAEGTIFVLYPAAAASSTFGGWEGCPNSWNTACVLTMDSDKTLSAIFRTNYPMAVEIVETGRVSFSTGGSCTANCSQTFSSGTAIVITADTSGAVPFSGWNGCDTYGAATCTVTMTGARSVTAIFGDIARGSFGYSYLHLKDAYDRLYFDGDSIRIQAGVFPESLYLNRNMTVRLHGGFDRTYTAAAGWTTIRGTLTITNGTAVIDNIAIR